MATNENEEDCVPCKLQAGIGMMLDACKEFQFKGVNCDDIEAKMLGGELTFNEAINELLEGARKTPESWKEFDEIISTMEKAGVIKDE